MPTGLGNRSDEPTLNTMVGEPKINSAIIKQTEKDRSEFE